MRIWAVANQKGGVGKTTTAVSIAGWLAERGHRVLLVDLDPHASLSEYFGVDIQNPPAGTYDCFAGKVKNLTELARSTGVENLSLVPGSAALATLERQHGTRKGMGRVLAEALPKDSGFDYVVLDCPPTLGILMVNALAACDSLLIPTQTEPMALRGLEGMLRTLAMISRARGIQLRHLIVPTLFDRRTRAGMDSLRELERRYGAEVWDDAIPVDTLLREASRQRLPLNKIDPHARGAVAYKLLLDAALQLDAQPVQEQAA